MSDLITDSPLSNWFSLAKFSLSAAPNIVIAPPRFVHGQPFSSGIILSINNTINDTMTESLPLLRMSSEVV